MQINLSGTCCGDDDAAASTSSTDAFANIMKDVGAASTAIMPLVTGTITSIVQSKAAKKTYTPTATIPSTVTGGSLNKMIIPIAIGGAGLVVLLLVLKKKKK